ncbi:translation initiation factor IF-2-like [Scyliorhinus canicula]|uniref:translation initiation factor IF-2-like n=1 Tax=Scyliorhinus canicula TaxID=7830 RepID=UPI0018F3320F|nr:translation initiation factor IF-2-like [Scyliorhinus canicula]
MRKYLPSSPFRSKLLSLLSRRQYNIEVAVNFTQTRAPPRCVRQTTVSSFFLPKPKGKTEKLPNTSTQVVASPDSGQSAIGREPPASQTELVTDGDIRRDSGCPALGSEGKAPAPSAAPSLPPAPDSPASRVISHREAARPPAGGCTSDGGSPAAKGQPGGRPPAQSAILRAQPSGASAPLPSTSQRTVNRERGRPRCREVPHSPKKLNPGRGQDRLPGDKENVFGRRTNPNPAPSKRPLGSQGTDPPLHCRNAPRGAESPPSNQPNTPRSHQNTLSLLFSQDSQGNRVISHRYPGSRCAAGFPGDRNLQSEHCNGAISRGNGSPESDLVVASECQAAASPPPGLLFTQDSEGNVVIRHV